MSAKRTIAIVGAGFCVENLYAVLGLDRAPAGAKVAAIVKVRPAVLHPV